MRLAILIAIAAAAHAQPFAPEVFGFAGYARTNGDEGSLGSGLAAGGAITIPFARHWAIDFDLTHIRGERPIAPNFLLFGRHTHINPAIQYRRGSERTYGFVAGGPGATFAPGNGEDQSGFQWNFKTGLVTNLTGRLLIRAEFFANFRYVLPDAGGRAGVGWRF
jgi:hypothetical protein